MAPVQNGHTGGMGEMPAAAANRADLLHGLALEPAVLVTVVATQGSTPREAGAWMAVFADRLLGTIGGGHLEWEAVALARERLRQPHADAALGQTRRLALGPSLGQCCGGAVELRFEFLADPSAASRLEALEPTPTPVAIFGAGHVGQALVQALLPLPFALRWVDSRDAIFPAGLPARVQAEHSDPVQRAVRDLRPGSHVLVMSFSHAEDLEVVAASLQRQREQGDLAMVGLIGSKTKWASFRQRLSARGYTQQELAQVSCPIGLPGIPGKQPAVIAASVAAQLLLARTNPALPSGDGAGLPRPRWPGPGNTSFFPKL